MKGIIIIAFNENLEASIDTQYPSNLMEFLKIGPETLNDLSDYHEKRKMEPNFIQIKLKDEIDVASFYSGFSFRHYVGTPNLAVAIFLSNDDQISPEFEGMMRRIAHELLPKRDALNFDDILGKYYGMLKEGELIPYWEEIIEGESNLLKGKEQEAQGDNEKEVALEGEEKEVSDKEETSIHEIKKLLQKNEELEHLLEEKSNKIRELTRKFTDLTSEKNQSVEELDTLKDELSEQYIKLEKWNEQITVLNENNANLIEEVKDLNELIAQKDKEIARKDNQIENLKQEIDDVKNIEKEEEMLLQEIQDLTTINDGMSSEIERLERKLKDQSSQIEKSKHSSSQNLDTITDLKMEVKNLKENTNNFGKEKESLTSQIFDLKKEIKILRRERDHYIKLVKDNDLL